VVWPVVVKRHAFGGKAADFEEPSGMVNGFLQKARNRPAKIRHFTGARFEIGAHEEDMEQNPGAVFARARSTRPCIPTARRPRPG
jgi:hypothetical protein